MPANLITVCGVLPVTIAICASVMWDGKGWVIINDGNKNILLMATSGDFTKLPCDIFESLIKVREITILDKIRFQVSVYLKDISFERDTFDWKDFYKSFSELKMSH